MGRTLSDSGTYHRKILSGSPRLEIDPMYHCPVATDLSPCLDLLYSLILYRVIRYRLKAAGSKVSPEPSMEELARVQQHQIKINGTPVRGLSTLSTAQLDLFKVLEVPRAPLQ